MSQFRIKSITLKNFLSVGEVTQSVNFEGKDLVLVLGENLDQGGNDNRNGVGKCVLPNTMVTVRDTRTGEVKQMTMGEIYEQTKYHRSGSGPDDSQSAPREEKHLE